MSENEVEHTEDAAGYAIQGVNMELALFETITLRDYLKQAKKPWFPVRRGQVLKLKQRYQDKRVGDLILVVKDSANHEIFIATSGNDMYKKFSRHRDNFDAAHEAEVMKMFGKGAKVEKSETEEVIPNTETELKKLDDSDNVVTDVISEEPGVYEGTFKPSVEPGAPVQTVSMEIPGDSAQAEPGSEPIEGE